MHLPPLEGFFICLHTWFISPQFRVRISSANDGPNATNAPGHRQGGVYYQFQLQFRRVPPFCHGGHLPTILTLVAAIVLHSLVLTLVSCVCHPPSADGYCRLAGRSREFFVDVRVFAYLHLSFAISWQLSRVMTVVLGNFFHGCLWIWEFVGRLSACFQSRIQSSTVILFTPQDKIQ